jgi:osmotically-inducible protein OsmY
MNRNESEEERMGVFALGGALGALLAYFFDPQNGTRRRHLLVDRAGGTLRTGKRQAEQAGRAVAAEAYGVRQKVKHREEEPKDFDDATLKDKVQTELFRGADVPKGDINVNVQNGVVQLRGEVERPELIDELVEQARKVQGVRDVENLLHTPGTEAPMHE